MAIEKDGRVALVGYDSTGVAGAPQLNKEIKTAWQDILDNADDRRRAADILGLADPEQLRSRLPNAPFEVEPNEGGLGPIEIALLVFAGNVAYDVAKDLAKKGAEAALFSLWKEVVKPKIEEQFPDSGLGAEKEIGDT
jgi:hypothetical protein